MNKVILMGRLTRDPEVRYSNAAEPMAIARFSLAVDRRISRERKDRGDQSVDFINCVAFGKNGEFVERFFRKGQMVSVVGRLQISSYEDNTGQKRWSTDVVIDEQFFAESRSSFESRGGSDQNYDQGQYQSQGYDQGQNYAPPSQNTQMPMQAAQPSSGGFFEADSSLDDDDLPF